MATKPENDIEMDEAEIDRRREAALKRMLVTPHKPQKPIGKKKKSPAKPKPKKKPSH